MFDVFFPYQLLKQIYKLHILHLISKDILLNILYFFLFYNLCKIYDMLQLLLLIILLMELYKSNGIHICIFELLIFELL